MTGLSKRILKSLYSRRRLGTKVLASVTVLVVVSQYLLPLFPSSSPLDERLASSKQFLKECPVYGCFVYPLEIDEDQVQKNGTARFLLDDNDFFENNNKVFAEFGAAAVTRQSNQHLYNQDRAFIIKPFRTKQALSDKDFLIGVFDGHGEEGHHVASYIIRSFPDRLAEKLNQRPCCQSNDWIKQKINETFVEIDQEAPPNALRGGSTASVTLRIGSKLFVANAGDSRTIYVQFNNSHNNNNSTTSNAVDIPYLSRPDKAHLPDERARIDGLGGKIHIPPKFPGLSRVVVYSVAARPPETIGLAMSRSIGDWEWKPIGVIAEPLVDIVHITTTEHQSFVIAASDGVWDLRRPQFFAKRFSESLQLRHGNKSLLQTCVEVIIEISPTNKNWYRDDMTVIVIRT